jgi:hypothetical protein
MWWLIAWHNKLADPFTLEIGDRLRVPAPLLRWKDRVAETPPAPKQPGLVTVEQAAKDRIRGRLFGTPYVPPPHQRPENANDPAVTASTVITTFSFAIEIPDSQGPLHFQIQVSPNADFSTVSHAGNSATDATRWFYFNANAGDGEHTAFPTDGINGTELTGHPVYYRFIATDNLDSNTLYYVRWRVWDDGSEGDWNSSAPLYLA